MTCVQRFKLLDVDLAVHVCRRCVAGRLKCTISLLRRMLLRFKERDRLESFAHTVRPRRNSLVEHRLLHRCRVIVQDRYEPVWSRRRYSKRAAIL